mmetsp:Transcript_23006/g.39138  ORF Transcript_23006/g.39138 Transcript_23006/m.39138 type:complete len:240 (+) Transcript_23006:68-787(+)
MNGVLDETYFNIDTIKEYIAGAQNFSKGCAIVACGDVHDVQECDDKFTGFVHAELKTKVVYEVEATFNNADNTFDTKCSCSARNHETRRCKHRAAFLLILFALKNHAQDDVRPKWARRQGSLVTNGMHPDDKKRCGAHLTWSDVLSIAKQSVPRHNNKNMTKVTLEKPQKKKSKKRKKYCICQQPYDDSRPMVQCSVCHDWLHFDCLEKLDKPLPLDDEGQLPRRFKFECFRCSAGLQT